MNKSRVLVVDDEPFVLNALKRELGRNYEVHTYTDPQEALDNFVEKAFDIAILDVRMPRLNGVELAQKIRMKDPNIPIMFFTGYTDYDAIQWVYNTPGTYRMPKPWATDLEILVTRVIEDQRKKSILNNLLRDVIELLKLSESYLPEHPEELKLRIANLPSFKKVELYTASPENSFVELDTGKCATGLKQRMIEMVYSSREPKLLKEESYWVWGIRLGKYIILVYLEKLDEEEHNYLQLLREIFFTAERITEKDAEEERYKTWILKLSRDNIKTSLLRPFTHNVNNYLGAIVGYADFLLHSSYDENVRNAAEKIVKATESISNLVQSCRKFLVDTPESGPQMGELSYNCIKVLEKELAENGIGVVINIPEKAPIPLPQNVSDQITMQALLVGLENMKNGGKITFDGKSTKGEYLLTITWENYTPEIESIETIPDIQHPDAFRLYLIKELASLYKGKTVFSAHPFASITITIPKEGKTKETTENRRKKK